MKLGERTSRQRATALASAVGLTLSWAQQSRGQEAQPAGGENTIDRVVVTAQRREEDLIDVPIAVSAFDEVALERRQIDQAMDLQLNVPNIAYTKTNFTSSNFQIRGIGVSSVGASSDSGVETHFNFMPIKNPRLFETEYFDVERVEVLRGPQGTLYGRNATGGAVNVIARKPNDKLGGSFEIGGGDYNEKKAKGVVNLPLADTLAARFAGLWFERDGYTENLFTGNDVDGRDQWSARGSLRFTPSEQTDVVLTVNYYEEDSSRARTLKQMCHADPTGAYGCLPDRLAFEVVNGRATLAGTLAETLPLVLNALGIPAPALVNPGTNLNAGVLVPADLRKVAAEFDPTYKADETIATLEISHSVGPYTLSSITGYQDTMFRGTTDYNWNAAVAPYNGPALPLFGGAIPLTRLPTDEFGSLNGSDILLYSDRSTGYDLSMQDADQWSQELRLASGFEGRANVQVGVFYFDSDDVESYQVATTELDYAGIVLQSYPPYYINDTPSASLESSAVFGELYYDMSDAFRWTAGLRWTHDKKGIRDRTLLLDEPIGVPVPAFRVDETTFEEFTGRFGFDWKTGWGEDATLYAFYSRGYKAG
ncbi:MAG TPA: TonB-dependent receptor, partial [Steroidobacter sp.]|nr:TonB-dependent receptor [Steroidobacter sp.]